MNSKIKSAVVIIPTYNEAGNVKPTTKALLKVFSKLTNYKMQILFVDDSSPDGTAEQVRGLLKKHQNIHLLLNKKKLGLGSAYKKGMRYALDKLGADILFEFDADLSHDPNLIPPMLEKLEAGFDMVMGSRYVQGGGIPKNWGLHRKFLSLGGNTLIKLVMLNFSLHDWTTGYRGIKKEVVEKIIPNLKSSAFSGYTWQIGFLIKSLQAGYRVAEVPLVFVDRTEGKSKLGPEYIINTMAYILKVRLQQILRNRLFKFAMVGGIGALIQLVALHFYRPFMPFQLAFFLAIETAILSNFTLSNLWTFADRKLSILQLPIKFVQFNLTSAGSILIQQSIAFVGEHAIGLFTVINFSLGTKNLSLDTGAMYAVAGILVGMFWNFFAYNKFIWKKKS
jgi:dolichol-phosphate mannosyltransferase